MIHAESVPGAAPAAGRRPRALLVGALPGFRGRHVLRKSLEVVEAGAFDAVHALEASHPEVVVIDSAVPAGPLGAVLERLRTMVSDLTEGGTVLGLVEDSRYETGSIEIEKGDLLVFYSDGVIDRSDGRGELYGIERLKEAAVRSRRDSARITLYSLLGEVQGWSSGMPPEDDATLVVAKAR